MASTPRLRAGSMRFARAAMLFCAFQIEHAFAGEPPDKSGYNLFRPTPDTLLREFTTDRPDRTESPFTVDAGHFQVELDALTYFYDRADEGGKHETVKTLAVAPFNFKIGLCNQVDLQIVALPYTVQWTHDRDSDRETRASGFGDVLLRCKMNLWGNDGGQTAFGVMPVIKFPTSQDDLGNGALEGGIILPLAIKLPADWDLGTMVQVNYLQDSAGSDYHTEVIESLTIGHDIVGELAGYVELFSNLSTERHASWIATFDVGLTYKLSRNVQLDAGVNIGLTEAAQDLNPFIGLSMRF